MTVELVIERCDPSTAGGALLLASQAWPKAESPTYGQAIQRQIDGADKAGVVLICARQGAQVIAAQLGQVLPGRVAMIWAPCFHREELCDDETLIRALFQQVVRGVAAAGAVTGQSLMTPEDSRAAHYFRCGGFSHAADLLYMVALTTAGEPDDNPPFQLEPIAANESSRLEALISRTYVGTLDCPSLDGLREVADVITGYQAVGLYRPELWYVVRHGNLDVGCLLINLHPDVGHAEVVYLALTPERRGLGWGLRLAQQAKRVALAEGAAQVILAVDATNRPAIRLYEAAGFFVFDRRAVWIRPLTGNHNILPAQKL